MFKLGDRVWAHNGLDLEWEVIGFNSDANLYGNILLKCIRTRSSKEINQGGTIHLAVETNVFKAPQDRQKIKYSRNLPAWW